ASPSLHKKHGNSRQVQRIVTCNAVTSVDESSPSTDTDRTLHESRQQQEPLLSDDYPTRSFESVSTDFFQVAGKSFL
ncbi:hypothetical protein SK128_014889, partial [Halocaridina rubra]